MLDAIIQFVRNGLCCIKNLGYFQSTFLYDPAFTAAYSPVELPEPLNKTTPLEFLISINQFYAFASLARGGFMLLLTSLGKVRRIQRLVDVRESVTTDADKYINASLVNEAMNGLRNVFVGALVMFLGLAFFWLFANSWHVTETNWIGGLPGLIHALTVMESCLIPLLYYMYRDGMDMLAKATRLEALAVLLNRQAKEEDSAKEFLKASNIGLSSLEVLTEGGEWAPFWKGGISPLEPIDSSGDEKLMAAEVAKVKETLGTLQGTREHRKKESKDGDDGKNKKQDEDDKKKKEEDDKKEKESKIRVEKLRQKADELGCQVLVTRLKGYRELLYMVLNFVAFYGYMLCIIVYYYPAKTVDEDGNQELAPWWAQQLKLGMTDGDAEWRGNHAGDFMWTVEPFIILTSPFVLTAIQKQQAQAQKQQQQQQHEQGSSSSKVKAD